MTPVARRVPFLPSTDLSRIRCVLRTSFGVFGLMLGAASAQAAAPYVVADVATGRVLFSEDATMPWYPASVTKLMTTYVTLKKLRAGAISLDTPIPISKTATSVPPSKSGVKAGQEITLDNALKLMLVKSANDMAVVIAEGVGGTVENFAAMMNQEAANLGMRESHFVNPNGLFADGQQTSARDLAILARALLTEFPERAGLFNIGAVQLGKRVMKNTNGLVGRYEGIEGMKTGFICPSGFNLVAVANRNGQRLIAVVMGASSGSDRTLKAAQFLDKGFSGSYGSMFGNGGGSLQSLPASSVTLPPNMREDICVRRKGPAASEEEAEPQTHVTAPAGNEDGRTGPVALAAVSQPSGMGAAPRTLGPRAELTPIPVFVGRTERSAMAPPAANVGLTPVLVAKKPADKGAPKSAAAYAGAETEPDLKVKPANVKPLRAGAIGAGVKAKAGPKHGAISRSAATTAKPADLNTEAQPEKALEGKANAGKPAVGKSAAGKGRVHMEITPKGKVTGPVKAKLDPKAKPAHKGKVAQKGEAAGPVPKAKPAASAE